MYREDVLDEAWKRVRSNKGAAGIDEEDIDYIEKEIGVDRFLEEIHPRGKGIWFSGYAFPFMSCEEEKISPDSLLSFVAVE